MKSRDCRDENGPPKSAPRGETPLAAAIREREDATRELTELSALQTEASSLLARTLHKESKRLRLRRVAEGSRGALPEGVSEADLEEQIRDVSAQRREAEEKVTELDEKVQKALKRLEDAQLAERHIRDGRAERGEPTGAGTNDPMPGVEKQPGYTHLRRFTANLVRHSAMYTVGRGLAYAVAFAQALVLIQFLPPTAFGQVAIILVVASFVTLVLVLLFRRGTLARTFGRDDEDDEDDEDLGAEDEMASRDPRTAMGTGLLAIAGTGVALIGVLTAIGYILPPQDGLPPGVAHAWLGLAGVIGVMGALWETILFLPQRGLRPGLFVLTMLTRPILVLGFSVALVAQGEGVFGVVIGQILATALAFTGAMIGYRKIYRLRLDGAEVKPIVRLSAKRWPRNLSMWVLRTGDMLMLASVGTTATVGFYRLASRLTLPISVPITAFFQAWLPLEGSATMLAARQVRGREPMSGLVITYLAMVVVGCLLLLIAFLEFAERLVPPGYEGTMDLVPWLIGVALAHVLLHIAHRFGRMANRRVVYDRTLIFAALASIPITIGAALAWDAVGAAAANITVVLSAASFLWWRSQTGAAPVPIEWRRITATVALGAGCALAALLAGTAVPSAGLLFDVAASVAFVLLLLGLRIVPRRHREAFRRVRTDLRSRRTDAELAIKVRALTPDQRETLRRAIQEPASEADRNGTNDTGGNVASKIQLEALGILRRCTGTPPRPPTLESAIASYLFGRPTFLERHHAAFALYSGNVLPNEVAMLERWRDDLRHAILSSPSGRDL